MQWPTRVIVLYRGRPNHYLRVIRGRATVCCRPMHEWRAFATDLESISNQSACIYEGCQLPLLPLSGPQRTAVERARKTRGAPCLECPTAWNEGSTPRMRFRRSAASAAASAWSGGYCRLAHFVRLMRPPDVDQAHWRAML